MALNAGTINADSGMSQAIYEALYVNMKSGFENETPSPEVIEGWKKLAFIIAKGVIDHLKANMEITGISSTGTVTAEVTAQSGSAEPNAHTHQVTLPAAGNGIVLTLVGDTTGHVQ
jgi:hypothetical protein